MSSAIVFPYESEIDHGAVPPVCLDRAEPDAASFATMAHRQWAATTLMACAPETRPVARAIPSSQRDKRDRPMPETELPLRLPVRAHCSCEEQARTNTRAAPEAFDVLIQVKATPNHPSDPGLATTSLFSVPGQPGSLACASSVAASLTSNLPGPSTLSDATLPSLTSIE